MGHGAKPASGGRRGRLRIDVCGAGVVVWVWFFPVSPLAGFAPDVCAQNPIDYHTHHAQSYRDWLSPHLDRVRVVVAQ